jgi:hypothetical protein
VPGQRRRDHAERAADHEDGGTAQRDRRGPEADQESRDERTTQIQRLLADRVEGVGALLEIGLAGDEPPGGSHRRAERWGEQAGHTDHGHQEDGVRSTGKGYEGEA